MKIYTLIDPRNNEIRYIGITKNSLKIRLTGHLHDCKIKKVTHKINWIKNLLSLNLKPTILLLEEVEDIYGYETEIYWISQFKTWGFNLVNSTEGGPTPMTKSGKANPNYGNKYNINNKTVKGAVLQLNYDGNIIKEYCCVAQTETDGFSQSVVSLCVHYIRTQHKGFQFIYKENFDSNKNYKFIRCSTQKREVDQIDKITLKVINTFKSANEAGKYMGSTNKDQVSRVCRGERKTYKGFIWKYKDNN